MGLLINCPTFIKLNALHWYNSIILTFKYAYFPKKWCSEYYFRFLRFANYYRQDLIYRWKNRYLRKGVLQWNGKYLLRSFLMNISRRTEYDISFRFHHYSVSEFIGNLILRSVITCYSMYIQTVDIYLEYKVRLPEISSMKIDKSEWIDNVILTIFFSKNWIERKDEFLYLIQICEIIKS